MEEKTTSPQTDLKETDAIPKKSLQIVRDWLVSMFKQFWDLIARDKKTALMSSLLTIATLMGFWLSPLKTMIFHLIWTEKVNLELRASNNPVLTNTSVDITWLIFTESVVGITEGVLKISFDPSKFQIIDGKTIFNTSEVSHALLADVPLKLKPLEEGTWPIFAELNTKYGLYYDTIHISSESTFGTPTSSNWSGEWFCKMGSDQVILNLSESSKKGRGNSIHGEYVNLDNGETGLVKAYRDGSKFHASFYKEPNHLEKWDVEADFNRIEKMEKSYIEIEGEMLKYLWLENGWTTDGSTRKFYASTPIDY